MKHLGTIKLETERLILRPFRVEDSEDMYRNWASSDHVTKFLTWPTHSSIDVTKMVVNSWIERNADLKSYQWCMEYKENHRAIGSIGVVHVDERVDAMEIGYCIGENYWHLGITTEALKRIMQFLFDEVGVNRLLAKHDVKNPNSGKVMKKAGLFYEGTNRQAGRNNTGICDISVYAVTKDQYKGNE